jgi:hypothetical protein
MQARHAGMTAHEHQAAQGQPAPGLILARVALVFGLGFMAKMVVLGG